jgi:hypothetical protein
MTSHFLELISEELVGIAKVRSMAARLTGHAHKGLFGLDDFSRWNGSACSCVMSGCDARMMLVQLREVADTATE